MWYVTRGDRLIAADTGKGSVLPIFESRADAEEFVVGSKIEGDFEIADVLCPDMLEDLCTLCISPGAEWIVMNPPPGSHLELEHQTLIPLDDFLDALRKVYAEDAEEVN